MKRLSISIFLSLLTIFHLSFSEANADDKNSSDTSASVLEQALQELRMSGIKERSLKVGQRIPQFNLSDAKGGTFDSGTALGHGPLVLVFYRGGWCPYCNLHLRELQKNLAEIKSLGAELVAISPQNPDSSMTTSQKNKLDFSVLSDAGSKVASQFGIVYPIPPKLMEIYKGFGVDLEKLNATKEWSLPLPASYVVDRSGKIAYAFVEEDYKQRADPQDIINAWYISNITKQLTSLSQASLRTHHEGVGKGHLPAYHEAH